MNATTLGTNGGTTMGLIITSRMASEANASGPLMDLLIARGAMLDLKTSGAVIPDWAGQNVLHNSLANHAPRAVEKLIELGAKPDLCVAAALGSIRGTRPADWSSSGFSSTMARIRTSSPAMDTRRSMLPSLRRPNGSPPSSSREAASVRWTSERRMWDHPSP